MNLSNMDLVVWIVMLVASVMNIGASIYAIRRCHGLWRFAVGLPILGLLVVGLSIILGVWREPTSHNLWRLEILVACGCGVIFVMGVMGLERWCVAFRKAKGTA